jgi:hypothetical protein
MPPVNLLGTMQVRNSETKGVLGHIQDRKAVYEGQMTCPRSLDRVL